MKIDRVKLLELADLRNQKVLDIGAGDLALIAAKDFNCYVTSIDVSRSVLRDEKRRIEQESLENMIDLVRMDASNLCFDDCEFQVVVSYGALHHNNSEDRRKILEELKRVCIEKLLIMEFKKKYHPHPQEVYESIDHSWLEKVLKSYGKVDKYVGKEKILYICSL